MNQRVGKLRSEVVKPCIPQIDDERAILITEAYKRYGAHPAPLRRAKALKHILKRSTMAIGDGELIVGNLTSKPLGAPVYPEFDISIEGELKDLHKRPHDMFLVDKDVMAKLQDIFEYWRGKTHADRCLASMDAIMPEKVKEAWDPSAMKLNGVIKAASHMACGDGHVCPDYEKVLDSGLKGIIDGAEKELAKTDPLDFKKIVQLKSMILTDRAVIDFSKRFATLSREKAVNASIPKRKEELMRIAEILDHVPENPPRSFWEALQSVWFVYLCIWYESNGHSMTIGRIDQYLYPYYERDIEDGRLTRDEALELIECFLVKVCGIIKYRPWHFARYLSGHPIFAGITLGGQTRDGRDATNDLSYLFLDACADLKIREPVFQVRIYHNSPDRFLVKAVEKLHEHGCMPNFFNDEVCIPALTEIGVPIEEARDYVIESCAELQVPGKTCPCTTGVTYRNTAKILELAFNNGVNPDNKTQLCPGNGDLSTFRSFSDVVEAYKRQSDYYVRWMAIMDQVIAKAYEMHEPVPFLSTLMDYTIEKGKDIEEPGTFEWGGILVQDQGIVTAGNSLAAIKRQVFDSKEFSPKDLKHALDTNFSGEQGEEIRQMLLKAPKFGNDDDYVDDLVNEVAVIFAKEIRRYKPSRGSSYGPSSQTISANVPCGEDVGATPDGRKAREALADNLSPEAGTDVKGPTAVIKSNCKIDHVLFLHGNILNMKFPPTVLESEAGRIKFVDMLRTFSDLRGFQVQFNMYTSEMLRDAQEHPENYSGLLVKVAGYSAYFVELDRKLQDQIIARTEHKFY